MSSDFLAGTGFHKDNDIYSRMADDKIVIKGKHYINSTPPIALAARINQTSIISEAPKENNSPVLVKANQTATYLPGEGFSVSIDPAEFDTVVEIEPRREAPEGFVTNHLQEIENGMIRIKNMSREPKKIKINTPICQVRKTVDTELQIKNNKGRKDKIKETKPKKEIKVDLSKIKIDPGEQLTEIERKEIREMLKKYEDIFGNDLPGYNHKFGKVEASFQWASLARPPISRARMQCTARKKISQEIVKLETQTKPSKPGEFCNADVLIRDKRKILVVRDNLTSFTQTKFIDSEKKEDLRSGLASLINPIKSNTVTTIRVDPHLSFKALKDKLLKQINITLEIGHEKNPNKNAVAEKAIQELEEEIKNCFLTIELDEFTLARATASLNSRIRFSGKSSKELFTQRDQFTGENLLIDNEELSSKQFERRQKDNKEKTATNTKAREVA